ncbi:MAG: hypothetical protein KKD31_19190 [Bacteroidetes bacterium]|nr:hypothetical protein [Bacteroidota bacterium]
MQTQDISCTKCGAPVSSAKVDLFRALASCDHCGAVFSIQVPDEYTGKRQSAVITQPEGMIITETDGLLAIKFRGKRIEQYLGIQDVAIAGEM